MSKCKQVLDVNKTISSMKELARLGGKSLKINSETHIFKLLQRFPFRDTDTFLYRAFQEEINFEKQFKIGWINYVKKMRILRPSEFIH